MAIFIFPSDPFDKNAVDGEFAEQAQCIHALNGTIILFDHEKLAVPIKGKHPLLTLRYLHGGKVNNGDIRSNEKAVYRGWMLSIHDYSTLEISLLHYGITMLTTMPQYLTAHQLPEWYKEFETVTPKTVWYSRHDDPIIKDFVQPLESQAYIVKDFVKSRKNEWDTACYAPSVDMLPNVINEFTHLQNEEGGINGGVIIRAYEKLNKEDGEARVWWVNGEIALITPHPDTPNLLPAVPTMFLNVIKEHVKNLSCPYITTDIALKADGCWTVIEVGDGQVSGLPRNVNTDNMWALLSEV